MKFLLFFFCVTALSYATSQSSTNIVVKQVFGEGYRVTIFKDQEKNNLTFIRALDLESGSLYGPTEVYQNLNRQNTNFTLEGIDENLVENTEGVPADNQVVLYSVESNELYLTLPLYNFPVSLSLQDQTALDRRFNLMALRDDDLGNEGTNLQQQIDILSLNLTALKVDLNDTNTNLSTQINTLSERVESQNTNLVASDRRIRTSINTLSNRLDLQNQTLTAEDNSIKQSVENLTSTLKLQTTDLANANSELKAQLDALVETVGQQNMDQIAALDTVRNNLDSLVATVANLDKTLSDATSVLRNDLNSLTETVNSQRNELTNTDNALWNEIALLKNQLASMQSTSARIQYAGRISTWNFVETGGLFSVLDKVTAAYASVDISHLNLRNFPNVQVTYIGKEGVVAEAHVTYLSFSSFTIYVKFDSKFTNPPAMSVDFLVTSMD